MVSRVNHYYSEHTNLQIPRQQQLILKLNIIRTQDFHLQVSFFHFLNAIVQQRVILQLFLKCLFAKVYLL